MIIASRQTGCFHIHSHQSQRSHSYDSYRLPRQETARKPIRWIKLPTQPQAKTQLERSINSTHTHTDTHIKMRQAMEYNSTEDERTISSSDMKARRPSARQRREPANIIITPDGNDILCGKEKHCIIHPGTRRYRQFIDAYQPKYRAATNKNDKMEITKEIVVTLGRTARFLRYNKDAQVYEELSHLEARDKTSHALRTACKRISKQRSKMIKASPSSLTNNMKTHSHSQPEADPVKSYSTTRSVPPLLDVASRPLPINTTPLRWRRQSSGSTYRPLPYRVQSRGENDHNHPLPIHGNEKMDGALFDDLLTLLKDPVVE